MREVCDALHALRQMQARVEEVGACVERDAVEPLKQQGGAVLVQVADSEIGVVSDDGVEFPGHGARELDIVGLLGPLVEAARRMAKVLAKQGGGDVEPLALGVDRAVIDDAGDHVGGKAVRGLRQLDGGNVDAAGGHGGRAAFGRRGVGVLVNGSRGPHLDGQGNDDTGCKRGGEIVYAAPAAFLFVVRGLVDEPVVDVAEAAGEAVVFHMVMSSEMSASLSEARSRMRSEAVLDFVQPMRAARAETLSRYQ